MFFTISCETSKNIQNSSSSSLDVKSKEKIFNVVKNSSTSDQRPVVLIDTVTGKDRIIEVDMNGEIIWEWKFPPSLIHNNKRIICKGADINYLESKDEILFIIPFKGAYIVNRDGFYKTIIEDEFISHDIDYLPNGNFIYVRGFVNKGDDEVREISKDGKIIWRWSHEKYFPDREFYLRDLSRKAKNRLFKNKTLKRNGIDWGHVNGVERFNNGDTLISIRNFMMFVVVDLNGNPKEIYKNIRLVHEPHLTKFGFIASDRHVKKGKLLTAMTCCGR